MSDINELASPAAKVAPAIQPITSDPAPLATDSAPRRSHGSGSFMEPVPEGVPLEG